MFLSHALTNYSSQPTACPYIPHIGSGFLDCPWTIGMALYTSRNYCQFDQCSSRADPPRLGGACLAAPLCRPALVHPVAGGHGETVLVTPRRLAGVGHIQAHRTWLHLCLLPIFIADRTQLQPGHGTGSCSGSHQQSMLVRKDGLITCQVQLGY